MNKIYPEFEYGDYSCNYYVEFNCGGEGFFTIFKRNFFCSKEEHKDRLNNCANENEKFWMNKMIEVHPYNLFTANYGPSGSMPDKNWVKFMVDALNKA